MAESTLKKRTLGKSGITVPEIGTGLWAIGGDVWGDSDDNAALSMIDAALDAGVLFFDTADVYGNGHSEEILGKSMKGRRDRFVVATKIGWIGYDQKEEKSAYDTAKKIIKGVESNLKRLKTDHVELIQSHINFKDPTMEAFLEGFRMLKESGKVKAFGVSTSDFDYLKAFSAAGDCATLQIDYSILNRTAESEIFPYCREQNIGVIVRGALAMGILTGKFLEQVSFSGIDFRNRWLNNPGEKEIFLNDQEIVKKLAVRIKGKNLSHIALQFVLENPAVSVVIPGARSADQINENIKAGLLPRLSQVEMSIIDTLVTPGGGRKIWPA